MDLSGKRKLKRASAIDIGSNTTLFLTGDVSPQGKVYPLEEKILCNGIGTEVFESGEISSRTIEKNLEILHKLIISAKDAGAKCILAVGTSALRNARNGQEFLDLARKELKLVIDIIDGDKEAFLTYKGYISGENCPSGRILLVDVGGGSCKFIWGEGFHIHSVSNLEVGAVRLHRQFNLYDPPNLASYFDMRNYVKSYFQNLRFKICSELVFSGGTATSLSALKLDLKSYSGSAIEGCELNKDWMEGMLAEMLKMSLAERKNLLFIDPDRAEVIIGGCVIMLEIFARFRLNKCQVTNRGLRYGLLYEWGRAER